MTDRDRIAAELAKDLARALVKPPPQGKYGEYISAFDVITTANKIFGWDGWAYAVDRLEQTNCGEVEKTNRDGEAYMQWEIGYMAVVRVSVCRGGIVGRQDVGHGQGHSKSLGDAHDSAMKEAVTDALKRALRTFGNPLGLALYDKTKAHVSDNPNAAEERGANIAAITPDQIERTIEQMGKITDLTELKGFWSALAEYQPGMQSASGVAEAKDAQRAIIEAKLRGGTPPPASVGSAMADDRIPFNSEWS